MASNFSASVWACWMVLDTDSLKESIADFAPVISLYCILREISWLLSPSVSVPACCLSFRALISFSTYSLYDLPPFKSVANWVLATSSPMLRTQRKYKAYCCFLYSISPSKSLFWALSYFLFSSVRLSSKPSFSDLDKPPFPASLRALAKAFSSLSILSNASLCWSERVRLRFS